MKNPLAIRFTEENLQRVEKLREEMEKRSGGASVPWASVVKLIIDAGLPIVEKRLDIK